MQSYPFTPYLQASVAVAALLFGTLAHAQWSKEQLREYTEDCVTTCYKRPTDGHKCTDACACIARDLQAQFRVWDYVALEREHAVPNSAVKKRFDSIVSACRRRFFRD
jgi:hypothetical protein